MWAADEGVEACGSKDFFCVGRGTREGGDRSDARANGNRPQVQLVALSRQEREREREQHSPPSTRHTTSREGVLSLLRKILPRKEPLAMAWADGGW